ncbi:MAG: hormogonium polysaccharide biosynthesis glycosyltransferase HpsE [Aphanocapsa sp. GSE-SYN-MK-11-07L]|jgi:glycosyltransferase involved in cell wall biosynthesis|nr:hormogonium polysaccharide biosynthesis glycosyltransferase HpsE [Aphanocapsa sp. GSE-SYN-MK-11-07L]
MSSAGTIQFDFTVAIRAYNSAKSLPAVLEKLLKQVGTESFRWEVLVVDNNSQDATAAVVADYAKRWRSDGQLRYVLEPRQGQSFARECAILNANTDLVGFLDDDNLPHPDWVAQACKFGQAHPEVGAYGSNILAKLDGTPPPDFVQVNIYLAISHRGSTAYCYKRAYPRLVPIGAGCVIRKQAWFDSVPQKRRLRGRFDQNRKLVPSSSEDMEIMFNIQNNWQVWHNGKMVVEHHLALHRLETDYLLRIARLGGLSAHACRIAQLRSWQRPLMPLLVPLLLLFDGIRVAVCYLKDGRDFSHDRGKACNFQFRLGRLLSPFLTPAPFSYEDYPLTPETASAQSTQ